MSDKVQAERARRVEAMVVEIIAKIEDDERFHYKAATIVENAPLALIQLEMETRHGLAVRVRNMLRGVKSA